MSLETLCLYVYMHICMSTKNIWQLILLFFILFIHSICKAIKLITNYLDMVFLLYGEGNGTVWNEKAKVRPVTECDWNTTLLRWVQWKTTVHKWIYLNLFLKIYWLWMIDMGVSISPKNYFILKSKILRHVIIFKKKNTKETSPRTME